MVNLGVQQPPEAPPNPPGITSRAQRAHGALRGRANASLPPLQIPHPDLTHERRCPAGEGYGTSA